MGEASSVVVQRSSKFGSLDLGHPEPKISGGNRFYIRIVPHLIGANHPQGRSQLQEDHRDDVVGQTRQKGSSTGQGINHGLAWGFSGKSPQG